MAVAHHASVETIWLTARLVFVAAPSAAAPCQASYSPASILRGSRIRATCLIKDPQGFEQLQLFGNDPTASNVSTVPVLYFPQLLEGMLQEPIPWSDSSRTRVPN
jgi:hypothetical protein